jgi:hypothetical protein
VEHVFEMVLVKLNSLHGFFCLASTTFREGSVVDGMSNEKDSKKHSFPCICMEETSRLYNSCQSSSSPMPGMPIPS